MNAEIDVFRIAGVGGFVGTYSGSTEHVLRFVLDSGQTVNFALNHNQLASVATIVEQLQVNALEDGELLHGLLDGQ